MTPLDPQPQTPKGVRARRMHATLREEDLRVPKAQKRLRLRQIVAVSLCAMVATALGMTATLHMGRQALSEHVARVADRAGVQVDVGRVGFDLLHGVSLEGVSLKAPAPHNVTVVIQHLRTDLGLFDLLSGDRRPTELALHGLHASGRLEADTVAWLESLKASQGAATDNQSASQRWRGTVMVVDGSADLDLRVSLTGLPETHQAVCFDTWSAQLTRRADTQLEAKGVVAIDGQERAATLSGRSGPDAALHLSLDAPVGVELSGFSPPLQLRLEGIEWARRNGALVLTRVAAEQGETRLQTEKLEVSGGGFPWLGADAPRSLAMHNVEGLVRDMPVHVRRGTVALSPTPTDGHSWAPAPREVRLEGIQVGTEAGAFQAILQRLTLGLDTERWAEALAGQPGAMVQRVDIQGPAVTLQLEGLSMLEDTAVNVASPATAQSSMVSALLDSDGPMVVPGGTQFLPILSDHHLSLTQGRLVLRGTDAPADSAAELDDVSFTWAPGADGGGTASAHALARRIGKRSGRLDITADVNSAGAVRSAQGALSGAGFAHVLSRLSDYVTVQPEAWLKVDFAYAYTPEEAAKHRLKGSVLFEDFGFEAWRIAHTPVRGLEGSLSYEATIEPETRRVGFDVTEVKMAGARFSGGVSLDLRPDSAPHLTAQFAVPRQDCGALARAVPRALLPRLRDLELAGELWTDATLSVDLADPSTVALDVKGSAERCRVVNLGGGIDLEALRGDFVHHPVEPNRGRRDDIAVGRGTPQWIPLGQLPRYLRAGAIATEDRAFRQHKGVRWDLLAKALRLNIENGRFVYGGSTITQQLVKNLYLSREKTLSRKLEELVISWEMERRFDKREILELYVNLIEYGPDIYGVRKAAHYYFGKPPWHLTPSEAAFIMGLKPYPRAGHRQWQAQRLNAWWLKRVRNVMRSVQRNEGALTHAQIAASPAQVRFRPPGGSFWSGVKDSDTSSSDDAAVQGQ